MASYRGNRIPQLLAKFGAELLKLLYAQTAQIFRPVMRGSRGECSFEPDVGELVELTKKPRLSSISNRTSVPPVRKSSSSDATGTLPFNRLSAQNRMRFNSQVGE